MALKVHSVFFYGHVVDETNNLIDFKEGAGAEKTAEIPVGSYTFSKFIEVVIAALNAASALDWSATVDRSTRIVTITSSSSASLLWLTGTNNANTPAALLGFPATDILASTSFVGTSASGSEYRPQFPIQDYKNKNQNKKLVNASVTKSASGDNVSVQSFGTDRFIKGNIKWITNQPTDGVLRGNSEAVEEAEAFMDYIVGKHPIEFMEDEDDLDTFDKVYLESTSIDTMGTSYDLLEYVDRMMPEYFETGLLTFKVINIE